MKATFRRNLRRLFCGILIFCQLGAVTAYAKPDWPADTGILAEAGVVMDIDSLALFAMRTFIKASSAVFKPREHTFSVLGIEYLCTFWKWHH